MADSTNSIRLSKRDERILKHVRRYRMTTIDALHGLYFEDKGRDAVKSTLRRLCGKPPRFRFLRPERLDTHRVYYHLTGRAARELDAPREVARPLGPQARIERYAVLWFVCIDRPNHRTLFNPREFPEQFDLGTHRLPRSNFYVEETADNKTELGFILVDHGSHTRRITRRAHKTLLRFLQRGWFDQFIAGRTFTLTVLTLSDGKRAAIQRRLKPFLQDALAVGLRNFQTSPRDFPIRLQIDVVPGLTDIIPGRS